MLKEQIRSSINTGEQLRRVPMRLLRADDFVPKRERERERERKKKSEGIEKKKCSSLKNALLLRTRRVWSDGNHPVYLSWFFFFFSSFGGNEILLPNRQREPVFLDARYLLAVQNLGRRFQRVWVGVPVLTANKRVRIERR